VAAVADLIVIVPSRERPDAVHPLAEAFKATCTADTVLLLVVDASDPTLDAYKAAVELEQAGGRAVGYGTGPSTSMVEALNGAAWMLVDERTKRPPYAIGFMGDDHCPRSVGWDAAYLEALRELGTGLVYGNDLLQGERIPTQVAMTADIVRALGYMAPPVLTHLYVDDYWKALGVQGGCLRYLPDVIIEHRHPFAGKAAMDAGYERVNDAGMYERDAAAYAAYAGQLAEDVTKVRALRGAS
jgi:hypothetical protein